MTQQAATQQAATQQAVTQQAVIQHAATDQASSRGPDLRLPLLGLGAWAGALLVHWGPATSGPVMAVVVGTAVVLALVAVSRPTRRRQAVTGLAVLIVALGVGGVALTRTAAVRDGPIAELARERALATLSGTVTADPRRIPGRFGELVLVRVTVGRHQPVLVFGDSEWERLAMRDKVRFTGRLAPADDGDVAATATPRGPPVRLARPGPVWRGAEAVRASIRESVDHRPASQAALVPALVDGDDAGMPPELTGHFQTTGLTHLTAVSGTNLTLVVGFLLVVARWSGQRGSSGSCCSRAPSPACCGPPPWARWPWWVLGGAAGNAGCAVWGRPSSGCC